MMTRKWDTDQRENLHQALRVPGKESLQEGDDATAGCVGRLGGCGLKC